MPDIAQRDPEHVASVLSAWLSTKLGADAKPEVFDVQAPGSNGFSNETILCRTRTTAVVPPPSGVWWCGWPRPNISCS